MSLSGQSIDKNHMHLKQKKNKHKETCPGYDKHKST